MAADTARIYRATLRHRTGNGMDRVRLPFNRCLQALRPQGTTIDLFYHGGMNRRLEEELHHNGLSIRCARINILFDAT